MVDFPLAVAPPQGVSYAAPLVDFSPLADLGNKFFQGNKNRIDFDTAQALKQGLPTDASGNIDYAKAAQLLAKTGNLSAVADLAKVDALTKPQLTQIGEDIYGNKQFGLFNPKTLAITPATPQGGTPSGPNMGDPNLTGEDYLKTLPPGIANRIKAIVEGRGGPPPSGAALRSPQVAMLMDMLGRYEPGFDLTTWGARQSGMKDFYGGGKSSEMARSANQTISHVGDLVASMIGLGNTAYPGANYVKNEIGTRLLGKGQVTDFLPNAHAVAEEMSKVFKGANLSDAEVRQWEASLSPNMSPEQQRAAVGKLLSLLNGSLNALEEKRRQSIGQTMADRKGPLLTTQSRQIMENVSRWLGGEDVDPSIFRHPIPGSAKAGTHGGQQPAPAAAPARPSGKNDQQLLADAKAAIAQNPQAKAAVIARLRTWGVDATGL